MRMKKYVLLLAAVMVLCAACEPEPWHVKPQESEYPQEPTTPPDDNKPDDNKPDDNKPDDSKPDDNKPDDNNPDNNDGDMITQFTITKLYSVVMRREIPYPFKAYVLQIDNGSYFYMLRLRYQQDLHVGDKISFGVFSFCPNEIARINGVDVGEVDETPEYNEYVNAGEYLVASDPIAARIKHVFAMKIRYSITFWPIDTWFIETTDGNLIYVKKSKVDVSLQVGDDIVYSVYTIFPNEVLTLKKL